MEDRLLPGIRYGNANRDPVRESDCRMMEFTYEFAVKYNPVGISSL